MLRERFCAARRSEARRPSPLAREKVACAQPPDEGVFWHARPRFNAPSFEALIRPLLTQRPPSPAKREKGRGFTSMSRKHFAYARDKLRLRRRRLRALAQFEIIGAVLARLGEFGAEDEIADDHLPPVGVVAFVRALNDRAKGAAPVGIFELGVEAARSEIEFGGDAGPAQLRDKTLVGRHMVAVEHGDDHRPSLLGRSDDRAVDRPQSREQPRHADRKTGRRNRFAAKARDEPVIAAAAADRAEPHGMTEFVFHREGQFGLEDGAGVIFEAADDGGVDLTRSLRRPRAATSATISPSSARPAWLPQRWPRTRSNKRRAKACSVAGYRWRASSLG